MFDRDEYNKQYYNNNKEKVLKAAKQWANNNKEYVKEYAKQWANNNKGKKAEHSKQWNNNNKEKKAEHNKLYYKNNKEELKEYSKQRYSNNKEYARQWYSNNKDKTLAALRKRYKETGCTLQLRIRVSHMYRLWRSDVFTRDDFTCQDCGRRGCLLHAHHEEAFADIMELNDIKTFEQAMACSELWNINNGTTLCKRCHNKRRNRHIRHNRHIRKGVRKHGVNKKKRSSDKKRRTKVTLRQARAGNQGAKARQEPCPGCRKRRARQDTRDKEGEKERQGHSREGS